MKSLQHSVLVFDNARYVGNKRERSSISSIIMHCTGGDTADGAISWLNRKLGNGEGKASYHYLIPKYGNIIRMAPIDLITFHAGYSHYPPVPTSFWTKWGSVNSTSIGISWVNDNKSDSNPNDDSLTQWQEDAALWLCVTFCKMLGLKSDRIFGHREVSPGRKFDPHPDVMNMNAWRKKVASYL